MLHSSLKISFSWVVMALLGTCVEGQNLRADGDRDLQEDVYEIVQDENGNSYRKDSYIISLKRDGGDVKVKAAGLAKAFGGEVEHVYDAVLNGFSGTIPPQAVEALTNNPNVASIERNYMAHASFVQTPTTSWGLDRVDQCDLPLNNRLDTGTLGTTTSASGGYAYIIDTGILATHTQFIGPNGKSLVDATCSANFATGKSWKDGNGHGTHVAGTMCGKTYGVARNCQKICAIRVLDNGGSGWLSDVIAGINHVANTAPAGSVANMSLGGGFSSSENKAVADAVAKGIVFVVAAGNDAYDACNNSPASEPSAITVGGTESNDAKRSTSNFGTCVDIFAPGASITSAYIGSSNTATATMSGTSMASPHVAGLAMMYREQNPTWTPAQIRDEIVLRSKKNIVTGTNVNNHMAVVPTLTC